MLTLVISSAYAYTPQYVSSNQKTILRWKSKKITITVSNSIFDKSSNIKNKVSILEAIKNSLDSWEKIANIDFDIVFSDKQNVSSKGKKGDGVSLITIAPTTSNLLLFGDKINEASAITRLFYNSSGEIKEADIVLNPILLFSNDGTFGTFDLQATLTHEIGHLLGFDHSQIVGSTMHSHQGKNGVYNLPGFTARTLSEDDIAGARAIYGEKNNKIKCCGQIFGNLSFSNTRINRKFNVWVEDYLTGKVIAGITTDESGGFNLKGLPNRKYKIYTEDTNNHSATVSLGVVDLKKFNSKKINKKLRFVRKDFDIKYLGFNGQLSTLAVPIAKGKSSTIYIGGKNLDIKKLEILFQSKNITVKKDSLLKHNYGNDISVISFEVQVSNNTPIGEYSVYLRDTKGRVDHYIGGITVENQIN